MNKILNLLVGLSTLIICAGCSSSAPLSYKQMDVQVCRLDGSIPSKQINAVFWTDGAFTAVVPNEVTWRTHTLGPLIGYTSGLGKSGTDFKTLQIESYVWEVERLRLSQDWSNWMPPTGRYAKAGSFAFDRVQGRNVALSDIPSNAPSNYKIRLRVQAYDRKTSQQYRVSTEPAICK